MATATQPSGSIKLDQRYKFAKLQVLVADNDPRSAQLVKHILDTFGIRRVVMVYSGGEALNALRTNRIDIVITEWNLGDLEGLALIKAIRGSRGKDKNLQHDMPIIMLTGHAGRHHVESARDAGITEFVGKPFSAKTVATRIIDVIDNPRSFVETESYRGPTRRRKSGPPPGMQERRVPKDVRDKTPELPKAQLFKPNFALKNMLEGANAAQIITEELVAEAHTEVMKSEGEFMKWMTQDVEKLKRAYEVLSKHPTDAKAREALVRAAYTIKSQAGMFGYDLATVVSDLLVSYLAKHEVLTENNLLVVDKHIETMVVVFTQKVKEVDGQLGTALVGSLSKLVEKLG